jgi:hypothetical protein
MWKVVHFFLGALATLVVLELVLRPLPVMHGWENPPVTMEFPMVRYLPHAAYSYSRAWNLLGATRGRFNNLGYAAQDVDLKAPTIAVIGDSFVEAAMIAPGGRIGDILAQRIPLQVAAFGISGADLPDYMVTADWVAGHIPTRMLIFVIVRGDLAGSVKPKLRGYWYHETLEHLEIRRNIAFTLRNTLSSSRLFNYLYYQLKVGPHMLRDNWRRPENSGIDQFGTRKETPTSTNATEEITPLMHAAAVQFIADAAALQRKGVSIALVFDADRGAIYGGGGGKTAQEEVLAGLAQQAGLRTISLADAFASDYREHHQSFEYDKNDSHWNAYGQQIVAKALLEELGLATLAVVDR